MEPKPSVPAGIKGNAFRVRTIDRFEEVQERLLSGWSLEEVALFIHHVCGELQDLSRGALVSALKDIRKEVSPDKVVKVKAPTVHKKLVDNALVSLDVLEELRSLYTLQRKRIVIDFNLEESLGKLFPATHKEIKVAKELLEAYSKVQFDTGELTRSLGVLTLQAQKAQEGDDPSEVEVTPKRRTQMLALVDRMLSLSSNPDVVMTDPIDIIPDTSKTGD